MAYNDIDSGKVLNKEGLLELCSQIKTEIANNSSGGGSSYTAGSGISIDSNDVISIDNNRTSIIPILYAILTRNSGMTRQESMISALYRNRFSRANLQYHLANINTYRMTYFNDGLILDTFYSLVSAFGEDTTSMINIYMMGVSSFPEQYAGALSQVSVPAGDSRNVIVNNFANRPVLVEYNPANSIKWTLIPYPEKYFQNIYFNSQTGLTSHSMAGAIDEVATRIPAAPTTDGTYTLQCVVSSGTPTYSWIAV